MFIIFCLKLWGKAVDNKLGQLLLTLSEHDQRICQFTNRQKELNDRRNSLEREIAELRTVIEENEGQYREVASRQALEDHRLKEEQARIVERRKQLTAIGGAKVAKMMEREIDIAGKAVQTLEDEAMKVMEEAERLNKVVTEAKEKLETLSATLTSETPQIESELNSINGELSGARTEREALYNTLEPRLQRLYHRVQGRYPASPVAHASKASCRACFRSLPQQTYNQIMAGYYLIQCPGCARILVYTEE